jgi:hypothetical protein
VASFVLDGAMVIAGVPGATPEQTTIVIGTDAASVVAVDTSGAMSWSTPVGEPEFVIRDIQATQAGESVVAGTSSLYEYDLWLARLDAQGQLVSSTAPDPNRGGPHADTLLRADESLVVVGSQPGVDGFIDHAGAFTYDAALEPIWEAALWGNFVEPVEPAELSDGTIIIVANRVQPYEGTQIWSIGLNLSALDPNGALLWTIAEICSVDIGARVPALASLSDDTILVGLIRDGGNELLRYDQDTLVSRERWPAYSSYPQIIADDQGGAWLVDDGEDGSHVAYWHPDPARRWVGSGTITGGVRDAWLEPGRRIWYTTWTGEVFAVSI